MARFALYLVTLTFALVTLQRAANANSVATEVAITDAEIKYTRGYVNTQGGAIRIFRAIPPKPSGAGGNQTTSSGGGDVTVSFGAIRELNASGLPVIDDVTQTAHALSTLRELSFSCAPEANVTMTSWINASADCLRCSTRFSQAGGQPGTFEVNACVIKRDGRIIQDNEESTVHRGQLKFSVELPNPGWVWCGEACDGGAGAWLELDIHVKLPPGLAPRPGNKPASTQLPNRPKRFLLAAHVVVEFSTKALLDDVWMSLAPGYPTLGEKDGEHVVTLRFPRFNSSMLYDPTVDLDGDDENGAGGRPGPWGGPYLLLTAALLACLATLHG